MPGPFSFRAHPAPRWVLVAALLVGGAGCSKAKAQDIIAAATTFAEQSAAGTLHWNVTPDGKTQLVVKNKAGVIQKSQVTGQLTFSTEQGKSTQTVPLALDEDAGVLRAEGPTLDNELTEVRYALLVGGKPWTGTLHMPNRGTQGLVETAKASPAPARVKAAHGGEVHVIDGQRYELVADADSGEVRVYTVDAGKKPKKLKLALDADPPRQVELVWSNEGYYVASIEVAKLPRKMSLVVVDAHDDVHVVVVGYRPGVVFVVDRQPVFWVHRGWGHPGRGHYKGTPFGPPGHYRGQDHVIIERRDYDHGKGGKHKGKGK